jgi:hypothetical protein
MFKSRSADTRPRTRKTTTGRPAAPARNVRPLSAELLSPRTPYEALRSGPSFFEQVLLIDRGPGLSSDRARSRRRGR